MDKHEDDLGAGDQGFMIGYATNESKEMLPMTMVLSTRLALELKRAKDENILPWLGPDAKT